MLNKIFRAVHDGVCPKCGKDIHSIGDRYVCQGCFVVTEEEMAAMSAVISEWGADAVKVFEEWKQE
jgi:tRNA(Ile2) C34 agmatinyltransferase TiaS